MTDKRLLCIGHRGAMGHAPENTLASISKALELGVDCIEVDVYYVDGELIVFHDDRLERVTDGSGYVQEQSFKYLRSLNAGENQQIPTLREACELIDARAGINIELKGRSTAAPVAQVIGQLLDGTWNANQILVSSFDHRELLSFKQLAPDIKIGALIASLPVDDSHFAEELGAYSVHPCLECLDESFVRDAHARGLRVYVFTVNHPEDIAKMRELGVDGIFTNYPDRVHVEGVSLIKTPFWD